MGAERLEQLRALLAEAAAALQASKLAVPPPLLLLFFRTDPADCHPPTAQGAAVSPAAVSR